jgi:hypothetical protein
MLHYFFRTIIRNKFLEFGSEAQAAGIESVLVSYFVQLRGGGGES